MLHWLHRFIDELRICLHAGWRSQLRSLALKSASYRSYNCGWLTDMAVILAYGSPALGHLFPLAALLSELAERGHRVHLHTMSGGVNDMRVQPVFTPSLSTRALKPSSDRIGWRETHWKS